MTQHDFYLSISWLRKSSIKFFALNPIDRSYFFLFFFRSDIFCYNVISNIWLCFFLHYMMLTTVWLIYATDRLVVNRSCSVSAWTSRASGWKAMQARLLKLSKASTFGQIIWPSVECFSWMFQPFVKSLGLWSKTLAFGQKTLAFVRKLQSFLLVESSNLQFYASAFGWMLQPSVKCFDLYWLNALDFHQMLPLNSLTWPSVEWFHHGLIASVIPCGD